MKKIIFFAFILFVGCSSSKSIVTDTTILTMEKTRVIDTTLKILNPIEKLTGFGNYTEPIKIEFKDYTFESSVDFETGLRKYEFKPLSDSIEIAVKVNEKTTVTEKKEQTKKVVKRKFGVTQWLFIGFTLFIFTILMRALLKYFLKV